MRAREKRDGEPAAAEPETLADVKDYAVYPLRTMARLVGLTADTLLSHGVATLPRHGRTSPHRVLGRTILEYCGVREIERCARTAERGETQAEREKRAAEAVARIMGHKPGKPNSRSGK